MIDYPWATEPRAQKPTKNRRFFKTMSRTAQRQFHSPDGWHVSKRLERKARPAGRLEAELRQAEKQDRTDRNHEDRNPS